MAVFSAARDFFNFAIREVLGDFPEFFQIFIFNYSRLRIDKSDGNQRPGPHDKNPRSQATERMRILCIFP